MRNILVILIAFSGFFMLDDAYGLWIPQSPNELLEQSQTIFVGNITSVNVLEFAESSISVIEENGIDRQVIENYTLYLDQYTVSVEEFLKNPQNSIMLVLQPTTSVPGRIVPIGGYDVGDRVLFYLEKTDGQNTYSPESFLIPKQCDAKSVISKPRFSLGSDFRIMQDGVQKKDNFTAGIPMQFVYEQDSRTLDGKTYYLDVGINRLLENNFELVLADKVHATSNKCEWIATASWQITPKEGKHVMSVYISEKDSGSSGSYTINFIVNGNSSDIKPPLKQFESGISPDEIQCKDGLTLVQKHDDTPACVKPETKTKLIERGWIKSTKHIPLENYKKITEHPTVKAFYEKYPDAVEEIRNDHISYAAGSDEGFKVRMKMYFDEKYVLDHVDFKCYFQRIPQNDVPESFIVRYLKDFECEKRPTPAIVIIPKGSANPESQIYLVPEEITVVLGKNNTVTWINQDDTPSTLVSDLPGWSTGMIKPRESAYVLFNETGVYPYHGEPHPWKKGKVIVLEEKEK